MYCQPPLQSWGTFSLEKKGLIFLQRSTGRFSRGVSALLGRGGRAGWRAKCSSDREARSQGARGGFISVATLPPCPQRGARARTGTRPSCMSVWVCVSSHCRPRARWWLQRHWCPSPSLSTRRCLSFPFTQAKKREEQISRKPRLLMPLPSSSAFRWHREKPEDRSPHRFLLLFISVPRLGFCSSQEIVIHRACFFAKCNYPRPCVYGRGMVESNRK